MQKILYVLVILSIIPGQLLRLSLGERGSTALILTDLIIPLLFVVWGFHFLLITRKVKVSKLWTPLGLWLVMMLVSLIHGIWVLDWTGNIEGREVLVGVMYFMRLVEYLFLFIVGRELIQTEKDVKYFVHLLIACSVVLAILGFIQLGVYPDFTKMAVKYGWDPHQDRLLSTWFDPNFIGAFFGLVMALSLGILLETKSWLERMWLSISMMIVGLGLVLTFSRSGYLALMIVLLVFSLLRSRKLFLIMIASSVLILAVSPRAFDRVVGAATLDATVNKRVESWSKALKVWEQGRMLGVGYNYLPAVQDDLATDTVDDINNRAGFENSFLTILVTSGVLGLLAYLWLYWCFLGMAFLNFLDKNISRYLRGVNLGILAGVSGLLGASMFIHGMLYPHILVALMMLMAVVDMRAGGVRSGKEVV